MPRPGTPEAVDPGGLLAAAFARFNATSARLAESYQTLELEAARLRGALRSANDRQARDARRFAALIEALPGGALLLDGSGTVQEANTAAIGLLGPPVLDQDWQELRSRCFTAGATAQGDLTLHDGRRVSLAQKSLQPGTGRVLLLTDITDKRKIEDLLARHQRLAAMGEMAAALAHQIRTPLAAGLLYASNARRPGLPAEQRDKLLDNAISCLHDLERLIADMLQFARGANLAENRFTLNDLLDGIETAVQAVLRPGQRLTITCPAEQATLTGNRETLAGALLNLATNALHAAGGSADVRILARLIGPQVEILVSDNGPGVDGSLHQKIFEPFFTSRSDGTGLGLSVARSIARAHRGDVALVDSRPGRTTFSLRLPMVRPAARGESGQAGTERTAAA